MKKHPPGLYLLFFTEVWERFGFYTLQAIIILYMTQQLRLSDQHAYILYGAFSSMLYLTPVMGGYLADRYLGFQKSILIGAGLLTLGYLLISHSLFLGLSVIIVANGFFKPNVSSLVGALYRHQDPRKDSGFTIFYMGINIGSIIPPVIIGAVVAHWGWTVAFWVAAGGMFIGWMTFILGRGLLNSTGQRPFHPKNTTGLEWKLPIGIVLAVLVCVGLFHIPMQVRGVLIGLSALLLYVILTCIGKESKSGRRRLAACCLLILLSIAFWALYNQTYTSLMLYADRNVDRQLFGIPLHTEFIQFFNPLFIVLMGPMLSRLWMRGYRHSVPAKFSMGILLMGLGFILLGLGGRWGGIDGKVPIEWLIGSYFVQTIGELLLSPIGLAMVTTLVPKRLSGMMMGVWFWTQAAAFSIGSWLANLSAIPAGTSLVEGLQIYDRSFLIYGGIAIGIAVVSFLLTPYIRRLITGKTEIQPIK